MLNFSLKSKKTNFISKVKEDSKNLRYHRSQMFFFQVLFLLLQYQPCDVVCLFLTKILYKFVTRNFQKTQMISEQKGAIQEFPETNPYIQRYVSTNSRTLVHFKFVGPFRINNFPQNMYFLLCTLYFCKVFYTMGNII